MGHCQWSFKYNYDAGNEIIYYTENSSSFHTDNYNNNFLVLGKGPTDDINGNTGAAKKKF